MRRRASCSRKRSRCRPGAATTRCRRWPNTSRANSAPPGFPEKDVTVLKFDNPGDKTAALVVRYRAEGKEGAGGKPILLLSHMDVVAAKREDWVRDPFNAHRGRRLLLRPRHERREGTASSRSPPRSCGSRRKASNRSATSSSSSAATRKMPRSRRCRRSSDHRASRRRRLRAQLRCGRRRAR